jgi:carboxynorspermidine decarboxylase
VKTLNETAAEVDIRRFIEENRAKLPTPYYLIDEPSLLRNMRRIERVRKESGAKSVLALKCFSAWSVFPLMREFLDGTTSSSLFEARLGAEKFGKETHAYSVAWSDEEIEAVRPLATKVIFNSISQLKRFHGRVKDLPVGLRVNPGISHSHFDLADPARKQCRLGVPNLQEILEVAPLLSGAMFHCNCENDDLASFRRILKHITDNFAPLLEKMDWVSLGGGLYFTKDGYPLDGFCETLSEFARRFDVQIYLEPGESSITGTGHLVTKVLDVVRNEADIAVVDSAVETHMLDLLIYNQPAKLGLPDAGPHTYTVAGRTCLAGDVFGTYKFSEKLKVGDLIPFADASGYTMVKKNWFNGVPLPSVVVRRLDGTVDRVRQFTYDDFVSYSS